MESDIYPSLPVELGFGVPILGRLVNYDTVFNSAVVVLFLIAVCWLGTRRLRKVPGRIQLAFEALVGAFDQLTRDVLGERHGRRYLPLIGSLFLFLWVSNMMGVIPVRLLPGMSAGGVEIGGEPVRIDRDGNGRYDPGDDFDDLDGDGRRDGGMLIPPPREPTADLNVPLGLALLFFFIGLGSQMYLKGPLAPIRDLFMDMGPMSWEGGILRNLPRAALMVVFQAFMFFLNSVGKFAEVVSVSFRLFGNIFGGVVILTVVGGLLAELAFGGGVSVLGVGGLAAQPGVTILLTGFFGLFVGLVQAFVFTMLNLTYLSMAIAEE